jgi:hypothetical protein
MSGVKHDMRGKSCEIQSSASVDRIVPRVVSGPRASAVRSAAGAPRAKCYSEVRAALGIDSLRSG